MLPLMAATGLTRLPDFLIVAQERWDQVERRNQLLVRALAQRHPGSRFLFAEIPLRPSEFREWRPPRLRKVTPNIWTIRAIRPFPDRFSSPLADRVEAAQLRRALESLGIERPVLWTQDPRAASIVDGLPTGRVIYDLTDDWAAFESDPARRAAVQKKIEALGARADIVLACSRPLEEGAQRWSDRVHFLPNAVEPPGLVDRVPKDLDALPRPRLGYAGTLHSARLDVDLLVRTAKLRPTWSIVLLGPDMLDPDDRMRLFHPPNVHYLGVRPHGAVRSYLAGLDVCLLPNLVNDFTRSLDPLKLYEYLAAGRPVIATPVDNTPALQAHVAVATSAEQLVEIAERQLSDESPSNAEERREIVAGETWSARAGTIERLLEVSPQAARTAEVSVVIVSFNTRELLRRCLRELQGQEGVETQTIVVDNASSDGSVEMIRDEFPGVQVIVLEKNAGFGPANNVAFRSCRGKYIALLNSDAFLHAGALRAMVDTADRRPRAGAVGPRLLNEDGSLQRSAWPFPQAGRLLLEAVALHRPLRSLGVLEDLGTWQHDEERPVDFLIGACLLLRADALADVGGFDEDFWMYGEEADLQRRMAARDWQTVFAPAAVATHVGGASSLAGSAARQRHFYAGQRRFVDKHGRRWSTHVAQLALLLGSVLRGRWSTARLAVDFARDRARTDCD